MKTIVFDDVHGNSYWRLVTTHETFDRVVFIGDYWDSFNIPFAEQLSNFLNLVEFKKNSGKEVIFLIGNHDHHYFPDIGNTNKSGYQWHHATQISELMQKHRDLFQMAYALDNFLFTHAGVGSTWVERVKAIYEELEDLPLNNAQDYADFVNAVWKKEPMQFSFDGYDQSGDDIGQTPIWIRPRSLMKDGKDIKAKGIKQVVGHTQFKKIDIDGKATGGAYYFINTADNLYRKEYLVIENGAVSTAMV